MKFILFSILSFGLAPSLLLAYPNVGDSVTYIRRQTTVREGNPFVLISTQVLTLNSFKKDTGVFELEQKNIAADGRVTTEMTDVSALDLKNSDLMMSIMDNCVDLDGSLEKIKVAAGEFDTCKLMNTKKNNTLWLADVPFTIVHQLEKSENGDTLELELKSMIVGQEPK